jgi:hypothetical protein
VFSTLHAKAGLARIAAHLAIRTCNLHHSRFAKCEKVLHFAA